MGNNFSFSIPAEVSMKKVGEAIALCESEDWGVFVNELLDVYIKSKSMSDLNLKSISDSSEESKGKEGFEVGQTYSHTWSNGEKTVTVKLLEDRIEILAGSDFEASEVDSLSAGHSKRRESLVSAGYVKNGKFTKSYFCNSLSAAASIVRGVQLSGIQAFKKSDRLDWTAIVTEAISSLGGEAHLEEIYKEIEKRHPERLTPHYQNTVRGTIYRSSSDSEFYQGGPDLFKRIGEGRTGRWSIR